MSGVKTFRAEGKESVYRMYVKSSSINISLGFKHGNKSEACILIHREHFMLTGTLQGIFWNGLHGAIGYYIVSVALFSIMMIRRRGPFCISNHVIGLRKREG